MRKRRCYEENCIFERYLYPASKIVLAKAVIPCNLKYARVIGQVSKQTIDEGVEVLAKSLRCMCACPSYPGQNARARVSAASLRS